MENQMVVVLPAEVAQIAENVSVEKRNEVQAVLNHVFNGVAKMREQLDNVTVEGTSDWVNMKLANTIRLGVRQVRLDAEKTFDAKRAEVQQQMLSYKTEDSLWLKAKQTMQILTKEIEENARWKEETRERYEKEQHELKVQQRILQVQKFNADIPRSEIDFMSDETFSMCLSSIEKAYNDRIEYEKKAEEQRIAREKAEAEERERIRIENERLRKENQEKERQIAEERAKAEAERRDIEEKARLEREESERLFKEMAQREAKKAAAEKAALEAQLQARAEAEFHAMKEAEAKAKAEQRAKALSEKKAKNASDKVKLELLASDILGIKLPEVKGEEAKIIVADILSMLNDTSEYLQMRINEL